MVDGCHSGARKTSRPTREGFRTQSGGDHVDVRLIAQWECYLAKLGHTSASYCRTVPICAMRSFRTQGWLEKQRAVSAGRDEALTHSALRAAVLCERRKQDSKFETF